jgi:alanine racemase
MRSTCAVIDLSRLKKNYLNIKKKVGKVKIMAVVKADAYGHGFEEVVKALNSLKEKQPEYYAVAIPDEGVKLRKMHITHPILILEPFTETEADLFIRYKLIATVFTAQHLKILLKRTAAYRKKYPGYKIRVHVKIDTGMNRLGIKWTEAFEFIRDLSADDNFLIDGIYTHFATADERNKSFARLQIKRFNNIIDRLRAEKITYGLAHAANSSAILDLPEAHYDMVRPGILLYGYYPSSQTSESVKVQPVMSVVSKVTSVKKLEPGEGVSYGRSFIASKETNIASVPMGYADGFNRRLSNKAKAIIKGKLYPQIGNISMDRSMFDIGNDNVKVGDKVVILGSHKKVKITAVDWAKMLNTLLYEIPLNISGRVPRIYKD